MAWALDFDGVNDHLLLATPLYIQDGETIDLNIIQGNSSGYEMWLSTWDSNPSFNDGEWYFGKLNTSDGRLTLYNRFTTVRNNSAAGVLVVGEDATFSLQRNGNTLRALKNGVEVVAPLLFSAGHLDLYPIKRLMKENESSISFCFTGQLKSATFGNRLNLDATASDHSAGSQPVLTDTISGNNATGVNFPTDGSAWVDLGGGGATITADIATTAKKPTVLASSSATLPQPDSVVSITAKKPTVSIASSAEVPQPSAVVSITAKKPSVQASSSATLPQPQASASVTAKKATVSVISSASLPQPDIALLTTAKKPSVSVSGSASLSQANAVVSITAKKPTVQADSSATLPQPDATLTTSAKKPTVGITGSAVVPYPVSDIAITAKKPTVNTTGGATLPQPSATVTTIGKKPTVAISATVSGLVLVAPDDAKIKYQPGSNALTYYPGSNKLAV